MSALRGSGSESGGAAARLLARERQHRGLESREAEVEVARSEHRARQPHRAWRAALGEARQRRSARIRQAEKLRRLVERFAGGVVVRVAQQPVLARRPLTSKSWLWPPETSSATNGNAGRGVAQQRRQQVAFEVMDAERPECPARSPARLPRSRRRAARPRGRDPAYRRCRRGRRGAIPASASTRCDQRNHAAHVVARRELRHHAAVVLVHGDLRMERVREQPGVRVVHGDAGLVAGGFDAEYAHGRGRPKGPMSTGACRFRRRSGYSAGLPTTRCVPCVNRRQLPNYPAFQE